MDTDQKRTVWMALHSGVTFFAIQEKAVTMLHNKPLDQAACGLD